jgi:hypothetical protein
MVLAFLLRGHDEGASLSTCAARRARSSSLPRVERGRRRESATRDGRQSRLDRRRTGTCPAARTKSSAAEEYAQASTPPRPRASHRRETRRLRGSVNDTPTRWAWARRAGGGARGQVGSSDGAAAARPRAMGDSTDDGQARHRHALRARAGQAVLSSLDVRSHRPPRPFVVRENPVEGREADEQRKNPWTGEGTRRWPRVRLHEYRARSGTDTPRFRAS